MTPEWTPNETMKMYDTFIGEIQPESKTEEYLQLQTLINPLLEKLKPLVDEFVEDQFLEKNQQSQEMIDSKLYEYTLSYKHNKILNSLQELDFFDDLYSATQSTGLSPTRPEIIAILKAHLGGFVGLGLVTYFMNNIVNQSETSIPNRYNPIEKVDLLNLKAFWFKFNRINAETDFESTQSHLKYYKIQSTISLVYTYKILIDFYVECGVKDGFFTKNISKLERHSELIFYAGIHLAKMYDFNAIKGNSALEQFIVEKE